MPLKCRSVYSPVHNLTTQENGANTGDRVTIPRICCLACQHNWLYVSHACADLCPLSLTCLVAARFYAALSYPIICLKYLQHCFSPPLATFLAVYDFFSFRSGPRNQYSRGFVSQLAARTLVITEIFYGNYSD